MGLELHEPHEPDMIPLDELPDDGTIAVVTGFYSQSDMVGRCVQRKYDRLSTLGKQSGLDYPGFFDHEHDTTLFRCRPTKPGELLRIT